MVLFKSILLHNRGFLLKTKLFPIPSITLLCKAILEYVDFQGSQKVHRTRLELIIVKCSYSAGFGASISLFPEFFLLTTLLAFVAHLMSSEIYPIFYPPSHSVYLLYLVFKGFSFTSFLMYLKETFVLLISEMGGVA